MDKTKLNLGCGNKIMTNAINLDRVSHRPEVDVVHNLSVLPWPFEDEQFETVLALSVLEHLDINLLQAMDEIWRITKPGGVAIVKLPHYQAEITYCDPTHRYSVAEGIFEQLDPSTQRGQDYIFYTDRKWEILEVKLNNAKSSVYGELRKIANDEHNKQDTDGNTKETN